MSEEGSQELPIYLQQDHISQEWKDLVLSMPTEKDWVTAHLRQYQGFWHTTRQVQGVLSCQKHFRSHNDDIILVTSPKSGTTWLKAVVFSLLNRSVFPAVSGGGGGSSHPLLTANPHTLVPFLELDLYVDGRLPVGLDTSSREPGLFSTHLPYSSLPDSAKASACKLVYLCRDPKDVFVSLWHFTNKLRMPAEGYFGGKSDNSMEECLDKFVRGVSLYGPFWDHLLGYWKESLERPEKVLFLRYEDMKREPGLVVRRLAEFVGRPFSDQEEAAAGGRGEAVDAILRLCSFETLSNLEVNKTGKLPSGEANKAFFRRGEVGDWVNYLSPEMAIKLDSFVERKLRSSGLKF